jgi:serine protease AprX
MKTATKFAPGISTATDPVTGIVYTDEYDIFTIGAGYLNIPAALADTDVFTGSALSPAAAFDAATNAVSLEPNALLAVWGTSAIWGTMAVWGTSIFTNANCAVWGTGAVFGTLAVWGTGQAGGEAVTVAISGDN